MAIQDVVKLLRIVTKNNKDAQAVIDTAALVVTTASKLMKEAKPILDSIDTEAVAEKLRIATEVAAESAGKAKTVAAENASKAKTVAAENASKAKSAASEGAGKVKAVASEKSDEVRTKLADVKSGIAKSLANAIGEKDLKKAIKAARQSVLENATTKITVADLRKAKEKMGDDGIGPINDMPGCFVIATYRKMDFDKDLTDYTGIFVGRASNAAQGVEEAISKAGNPDVYADVKFKQNVHVYVYNCLPEQLDERYESLLQTFAGDASYN